MKYSKYIDFSAIVVELCTQNIFFFLETMHLKMCFRKLFCCLADVGILDVVFRQIEIVLKDSTAFVYVTQSEKSSH